MLFFYSLYISRKNIRIFSGIVLWLYEIGYKWLCASNESEDDLLGGFLKFRLPDIISGLENVKIFDIYMKGSSYKQYLYDSYPNIQETLKNQIDTYDDLPFKYLIINTQNDRSK